MAPSDRPDAVVRGLGAAIVRQPGIELRFGDLHPYYANISSYRNLPKILLDQIAHFFGHYKDLEPDKWVRVDRWGESEEALKLIEAAIAKNAD